MSCDRFDALLPDLLDGDAAPGTRMVAEAHAATCARCGALLRDLEQIRDDAARLPVLRPSRDLWDGIAARLETPVVALPLRRPPAAITPGQRWVRVAAAAAVLAVTGRVAADRLGPPRPSAGPVPVARRAPESARPRRDVVAVTATTTAAIDQEIATLRALVARRRAELDPRTVRVLDENLTIIDQAIARCRAALADDPASAFLLEQLTGAYDLKLQLLRRVATLPARTT
jgi:hypothetical protein